MTARQRAIEALAAWGCEENEEALFDAMEQAGIVLVEAAELGRLRLCEAMLKREGFPFCRRCGVACRELHFRALTCTDEAACEQRIKERP